MLEMFLTDNIWAIVIGFLTIGVWAIRVESRVKNTPTKVQHAEMQGEIDVLDTSVEVLVKTSERIEGKVDRLLERHD